MKEDVKNLQKRAILLCKMKEKNKNSSKNEKNIQKGVDKRKVLLYNSHIYFIFDLDVFYSLHPARSSDASAWCKMSF